MVTKLNRNYDTIAITKGISQRILRIDSDVVTKRKQGRVEKYSGDVGEYLEKLGVSAGILESMIAATSPPPGCLARGFPSCGSTSL